MTRVNSKGYVEWKNHYVPQTGRRRPTWKNWVMAKHVGDKPGLYIYVGRVRVPDAYYGKRIRLKIEEVEDEG